MTNEESITFRQAIDFIINVDDSCICNIMRSCHHCSDHLDRKRLIDKLENIYDSLD